MTRKQGVSPVHLVHVAGRFFNLEFLISAEDQEGGVLRLVMASGQPYDLPPDRADRMRKHLASVSLDLDAPDEAAPPTPGAYMGGQVVTPDNPGGGGRTGIEPRPADAR